MTEARQPARSTEQRKADVLEKLRTEVDCWVASASGDGAAHLIPLSFHWDGARLTVATPRASITARNLRRAAVARMALGPTRDVVILEGTLEFVAATEASENVAGVFAAKTGFDPRKLDRRYVYIRLAPRRIQAWREANELSGRDVMVDGRWLA